MQVLLTLPQAHSSLLEVAHIIFAMFFVSAARRERCCLGRRLQNICSKRCKATFTIPNSCSDFIEKIFDISCFQSRPNRDASHATNQLSPKDRLSQLTSLSNENEVFERDDVIGDDDL